MDWKEIVTKKVTIIGMATLSLLFIIIGIILGSMVVTNTGLALIILFSLLYFLTKYLSFRIIREYEEQFPNFLRDVSQSIYAGLTLIEAIKAAKQSDYKALNKEVKKINNQLSWNIPLEKVMDNFSQRVHQSKEIQRSVAIVKQAQKSGGDMKNILNSLAENMEKMKDVKGERKMMMSQHVTMVYAIFFIFVGISISLIKFLIPMLEGTETGGMMGLAGLGGQTSPCEPCQQGKAQGNVCNICSLFFHVSESFGLSKVSGPSYYKALFFLMIIIEGIFSGLVAGQIESDSVIAGIKHSIVLAAGGFFGFIIVNWVGFI